MADNDPEYLGELIWQLLIPQELADVLSKLVDVTLETKLRDVPGIPDGVKENRILGNLTVGRLIQLLRLLPIYYPNTPVAKYVEKTVNKGVINGTLSGLSSVIYQELARRPVTRLTNEITKKITEESVKKIAQQSGNEVTGRAAKETVKKVIKEGLEKTAKKGVEEVAEESAKKIVTEIAEEGLKKTVQQGGKEVAEETAKQGAKCGAFFGALAFGVLVEGVSFGVSCYCANKKLKRGEITKVEYNRHWVKRGGAAIGSLACSTAGATIGTIMIPIPFVGTFIGSVVGGVAGDFVGGLVGSKASKKVYDDRCVLCKSGEVDDTEHFLVRCEEFWWERQDLLEKIRQMKGTQEWIDEYGMVGDKGKMELLLGKSVKSLEREVGDRVNKCVKEEVRKWRQRRKELLTGPKLGPPNHQ